MNSVIEKEVSVEMGNPGGSRSATGSQVLELINSIQESIESSHPSQLGERLNALSNIFGLRSHETEMVHNARIRRLLGQVKRDTASAVWKEKVTVRKVLRNTQGIAIEDMDISIVPSVELIMDEPVYIPGSSSPTMPRFARERMLLRIYGIDIGDIFRILRGK